ncbi:MAG TPA: hypothetical protein VHC69_34260 [Polyangiaceae bacterium]|nr:hypothetical protein [Polyangiaceae bacterium]
MLRGAYTLPIAPVFVGAAGSYATTGLGPDGLRAKWTMLSADAGVTFQLGDVALRPRLLAVFAQLVAEAAAGPAAGTSGSRRLAGGERRRGSRLARVGTVFARPRG